MVYSLYLYHTNHKTCHFGVPYYGIDSFCTKPEYCIADHKYQSVAPSSHQLDGGRVLLRCLAWSTCSNVSSSKVTFLFIENPPLIVSRGCDDTPGPSMIARAKIILSCGDRGIGSYDALVKNTGTGEVGYQQRGYIYNRRDRRIHSQRFLDSPIPKDPQRKPWWNGHLGKKILGAPVRSNVSIFVSFSDVFKSLQFITTFTCFLLPSGKLT